MQPMMSRRWGLTLVALGALLAIGVAELLGKVGF